MCFVIIKCVLKIDWTITKLFIIFHLACKILFPLGLNVICWRGTMFIKFITPSTLANHILILVLCVKNSLNYWLLSVWSWCTHKCTTNVDGGSQVLTLFSSSIFIVLMIYCINAIMEYLQFQFIWTLVSWSLDLELEDNKSFNKKNHKLNVIYIEIIYCNILVWVCLPIEWWNQRVYTYW